jgi:ParB-like chromosome segregation protein Spo0J
MSETEFSTLVADIKENGLREPIIVHDGQVLDGRNRYRACLQIGIEPITRPFDQRGDPLAFVISKNLHRRHLDEAQRAMVASKIANLRRGYQSNPPIGGLLAPVSQEDAAKLMNVGERSVQRAAIIRKHGVPELQRAVESGRTSITAAAEVARMPEEEQRMIVSQGPKAIREAAKTAKAAATTGPKLSIVAPVEAPSG